MLIFTFCFKICYLAYTHLEVCFTKKSNKNKQQQNKQNEKVQTRVLNRGEHWAHLAHKPEQTIMLGTSIEKTQTVAMSCE